MLSLPLDTPDTWGVQFTRYATGCGSVALEAASGAILPLGCTGWPRSRVGGPILSPGLSRCGAILGPSQGFAGLGRGVGADRAVR